MFARVWAFVRRVGKRASDIFLSALNNIEATILLVLAGIGLTLVISELPFVISLPLVVESAIEMAWLAPVLSFLGISALVTEMQWRLSNE